MSSWIRSSIDVMALVSSRRMNEIKVNGRGDVLNDGNRGGINVGVVTLLKNTAECGAALFILTRPTVSRAMREHSVC